MTIALPQMAGAMAGALILLGAIIACANLIHGFGRQQKAKREAGETDVVRRLLAPLESFILLRILLDKDDHASLSSFQFLAWTLLISFLYFTLWFLQFLNSSLIAPPAIPSELMALMGISIAIPIASRGIDVYKENRPRPAGVEYRKPDYSSMLEEDGRPSLLRFQMFLWTLGALVFYFGTFLIGASDTAAGSSTLPAVNQTFLFLMGLSQTGYIGSKALGGTLEKREVPAPAGTKAEEPAVSPPAPAPAPAPGPQPLAIRELVPRTAWHGDPVTVLGSGFGPLRDTLTLDADRVPAAAIRRWEDGRIEFSVPDVVPAGSHMLRVVTGSGSAESQLTISTPVPRRFNDIDAKILGDIWIDDPSDRGLKVPHIGYFIAGKRYHFFYEYEVPAGTPAWGMTQFRTEFYVDGVKVRDLSVLPGYLSGNNYGVFDYTFEKEKEYRIEIVGGNKKELTVTVRKQP